MVSTGTGAVAPRRSLPPGGVESRYAWLRLAASVGLGTIGGVGMWSVVVALPAVQAEFGVARGGASIPYALVTLGFGAGGVLMGRLADRFGVFVPVVIGALSLGFGYMAVAQAGSLWLFSAIYGGMIGLFGTSAVFGPLMADASHWFDRRRGIAVALCASGNYFAGAVWPPVMQHFIETVGWRQAHFGVGVICLATMLPLAFVLRRKLPSSALRSGLPSPEPVPRARRRAWRRWGSRPTPCRRCSWRRASPAAWRCRCRRSTSWPIAWTSATARRAAPRCSRSCSPAAWSSRLSFGFVMDRIGGLPTLLLGSTLQATALALFLPFDGLVSLYVISAVFGLFQGGIVPSYAMIVREFFPARRSGHAGRPGALLDPGRHGARRLDVGRDLRRDRFVPGRGPQRAAVERAEHGDRGLAAVPRATPAAAGGAGLTGPGPSAALPRAAAACHAPAWRNEQGATMAQADRIPLARLIDPRSVAVVGASEDVGKFGGRVVHYLLGHGYRGRLLPINPNRRTIRGLPAFPSVSAAPEPADVAVLAVPAASLLRQVEECAAAGVGACIVITGKLADAGPAGAALQDRVLAVARAAGMRLLGPNCLGVFNVTDGAMLSSSLALEAGPLRRGGIGMASQSGALMGTLVSLGHSHGAGFSRCVSVGNQADIELCDVLEYLVEDPATRIITLYVEGLREPARFAPLLRRARSAGKPVLCVKAGRSAAGAQAARSHTASLAGGFEAFAAVCRDAGAVLLDDPAIMVLAADALDRLPRLPRAGMGVAVVASSGGSTAATADMLPGAGLRLGAMSEETRAVLRRFMPESHVHLPLDTGAFDDGTSEAGIRDCIRAFMADPDIGAVVVPMTTQPAMAERAAMLPPLCREGGRPLLLRDDRGRGGRRGAAADARGRFPVLRPRVRRPRRAAGAGSGSGGPGSRRLAAAGAPARRGAFAAQACPRAP